MDELPPELDTLAFSSWRNWYPDYTLEVYDAPRIVEFLAQEYGPHVVALYHRLVPYAFKADLFRYCLLYKRGGVYSDLKQVALSRVDMNQLDFVGAWESHVSWDETLFHNPHHYAWLPRLQCTPCQNCFFACVPGHPYLKAALDVCLQNVYACRYNACSTDVTGPVMWGRAIAAVRPHAQELSIDSRREKWFAFYQCTNTRNQTEFYVTHLPTHNTTSGRARAHKIIKHKYDNSPGATWGQYPRLTHNHYGHLWNQQHIYSHEVPKKTSVFRGARTTHPRISKLTLTR
jgi:mannosyltransferase OCH1-like enzyme